MEPKLIEIQPFTVSGISVRTLNSDEAQPLKAKLPGLGVNSSVKALQTKRRTRWLNHQFMGCIQHMSLTHQANTA